MKKNGSPFSGVAEIKLSYHPNLKAFQRPKISKSVEVYKILLENWDLGLIEFQEQFKIILLNRSNHVIGISEVSKGGIEGTVVDPRIVFGIALKAGASAIVLAHNHPSGNLTASVSDMQLTDKLRAGGKLLGIDVYDHLIISLDGYFSLADQAMM